MVPTPGHTPAHVSVIVVDDGVGYFLAGDVSYTGGPSWRKPWTAQAPTKVRP